MPPDVIPPSERIAAAFTKLSASAKTINSISDELAKPIVALESALQRLNLGVACWTKIGAGESSPDVTWRHDVGYAQVKGVWCIAVKSGEGPDDPEYWRETEWAFNEAPRHLRIKAVDKLPELMEALVEAAEATAKRMAQKVAPANELAAAVNALLPGPKK